MIADLKPYPVMKDSGVEWLGKVPEHWDEQRAKYFYREVDERSITGDEELMSVSHKTGVTPRKQHVTMFMAENNIGHKICRTDDLVINTMWAFMAALGIARQVGVVSPSYGVYRPVRPGKMVPDYMDRLLRIEQYKSEYMRRSTGINSSRLRLYPDEFLRIPIISPPPEEQAAIVRYLDHTDRRVRRLVRAKQKLIGLLEEQKQAIIHRAVTRGLDPNVPLKPSGVEWLGDVPEHWEVKRLRYLIEGKLKYGANAAAEHANRDWPRYLRITDFGLDGTLRSDTFRSLPPSLAKDYLVQPGDLLLARSGATVGKAFLVTADAGQACHAGYLIRARPRRAQIEPEYLFAFTQSTAFMQWKNSTFIIATIQNISAEKYADLPVPTPTLAEQTQIMLYLDKATAMICTAINYGRREIELLREYRTRLIADVVTGKLDVRQAAANLPDEPDEPEPLDEADALMDSDNEMAEDLDAIPDEAEA